ncbi:MAG: hypothetical protein AABX11_06575 [Nanoarchaeota archaeon]
MGYKWLPKKDARYIAQGMILTSEVISDDDSEILFMHANRFQNLRVKRTPHSRNISISFNGQTQVFGVIRGCKVEYGNRDIRMSITRTNRKDLPLIMCPIQLSEPNSYFLIPKISHESDNSELVCTGEEGLFGLEIFPENRLLETGRGIERFLYLAEIPPSDFNNVKERIMETLDIPHEQENNKRHSMDDGEAFNYLFNLAMKSTPPRDKYINRTPNRYKEFPYFQFEED